MKCETSSSISSLEGLLDSIETAMEVRPQSFEPMSGGMVGEVYQIHWPNGECAVAKVDQRSQPQLEREGYMLQYLAKHSELPVPQVFYLSDALLIMEFLPGTSHFTPDAEYHAAELLAALHTITPTSSASVSPPTFKKDCDIELSEYGLEQDTLIGLFEQPNPWSRSWLDFYAEHRLLHLGKLAVELERMPVALLHRVEKSCTRLGQWLDEPTQPSLVHGDVWTTNILAVDDRITGFLDPAIYYGHHEIELAYILWTGTFGEPFFQRYAELRPIQPGFFELRQVVYSLYPLLSHICHFGGHFVEKTKQALARLGC